MNNKLFDNLDFNCAFYDIFNIKQSTYLDRKRVFSTFYDINVKIFIYYKDLIVLMALKLSVLFQ